MYSFSASPGSSFIILDHVQEGKDHQGNQIEYKVDFAFVLGLIGDEQWDEIAVRLLMLLDTFILLKEDDKG